jgi:pyruvate ferredoxin oxidoreductase alpha subunit
MGKRKGVESSIALADSAAMCRIEAIAAYPITPQTHIVEHLSEWVNDGHLEAEFVPVESEHSAMSAALGMSAVGARTFTATASQGLALMHEILFIASAMRLPIVMAVANRSLSGPISIWNDHSDIMAERDIGWVQIFAENGQECFDLTPACFRVAEDKRVVLPTILNFDGFVVSHMIEPIEFWTQEQFDAYLPPFDPQIKLDVRKPVAMGAVGIPEIYYEARLAQQNALLNAKGVVVEAFAELEKMVGRKYNLVETYKADDADAILYLMGPGRDRHDRGGQPPRPGQEGRPGPSAPLAAVPHAGTARRVRQRPRGGRVRSRPGLRPRASHGGPGDPRAVLRRPAPPEARRVRHRSGRP